MNTEQQISTIIATFNRPGVLNLLQHIREQGFFESPASSRFHNCKRGGLAIHSINVTRQFLRLLQINNHRIHLESVYIVGLFHDLCKMGLYEGKYPNWELNRRQLAKGHALESLRIIKKFIELKTWEENAIKYHMGFYHCHESGLKGTEYSMKEYLDVINADPTIELFHYADNMEAKFPQ